MIAAADLKSLVRPVMSDAASLFDAIDRGTRNGEAILRPSYGPGEHFAADTLAARARENALEVTTDFAGNIYMTYAGTDRTERPYVVGSHLDAAPHGGNFDGLAGVIAGLTAAAALERSGTRLKRDVTVMGIRGEENAWFGAQHIGSRIALGMFDPDLLDSARRFDTGRPLREYIAEAGFDIAAIRRRARYLDPARIEAYVELHIEQGPLLESRGLPVGVVTGIRGNVRCAEAICMGRYDHSGTVPHELRKDTVLGAAMLAVEMDQLWQNLLERGEDLVLTFGKFGTDPAAHSMTTIPGEVRFSFDARSHSAETLAKVKAELLRRAGEIASRRRVEFRFGPFTEGAPTPMDAELRKRLAEGATTLGLPFMEIASGAGHDAADFALAGVPAAMIFVRNQGGSHNPAEKMRIDDFAAGVELLLWLLTRCD